MMLGLVLTIDLFILYVCDVLWKKIKRSAGYSPTSVSERPLAHNSYFLLDKPFDMYTYRAIIFICITWGKGFHARKVAQIE